MKFKKIVVFTFIILFIFFTYYFYRDNKLNYVSLGDSVAAGQNPYGEIGYGYTDYIKDYLDSKSLLKNYSDYAISGYKTSDVINDINNNKIRENSNIRADLRESDLVTISIGANDFMNGLSLSNIDFSNIDNYLKKVDKIMIDIDKTFKLVREYAKSDIVVIGYYNPFPILFNSLETEIDQLFNYADANYEQLCTKYNIKYISIYSLFKNNPSFLPNPIDIHPNIEGYKNIANLFINSYFD